MPLVVAKDDRALARRLQRLAQQGTLRRVYAGIYTDDLVQPLESVVRREIFALTSLIAPGSIISHRSAFDGGRPTAAGSVFLTGPSRRDYTLPGVTLRMVHGPGPLDVDTRIPTFLGDAFISSQARALLENLDASRGDPAERRTLGKEGVEAWLDRFISRDVSNGVNKLRDMARAIAEPLGMQEEFRELDGIIGALLGTRDVRLSARAALARAAGRPYDDARVSMSQILAGELQSNPLLVPPVDPLSDGRLQAFIESYFSNYIEGTEFELEEAHEIVVHGRPLQYREDDSHDILGTYQAILTSKADPAIPQRFEEFVSSLQDWNRRVIESRSAKRPGEFKSEGNRAGNTLFVAPDLVLGTLEKGYEMIMSATTPGNRAALAAFVVAEVHPFADGNGRTSRLALNLFLTAAGLTRIIIPTAFRDDYISAPKAMSSTGHPVPLVRMFARAGRFSRWLDVRSKDAAFAALKRSNALKEPEEAKLVFDEREI
jgi:hypothetical protein